MCFAYERSTFSPVALVSAVLLCLCSMRLLRPQALVQEEAIRYWATTTAYRWGLWPSATTGFATGTHCMGYTIHVFAPSCGFADMPPGGPPKLAEYGCLQLAMMCM
jgi:hypothetical protein